MEKQIPQAAHDSTIIDQFSLQAIPFTEIPGHHDGTQLLVLFSGVTAEDSVLDVACGPGIVTCEFAAHAGAVTGVDITPAMIDQAARRQGELGITNIDWQTGTVTSLPYPDNSFTLVITRYSFHHLLDPVAALAEMIRVCRPGGRVLVADVAVPADKSKAYDRLEILRDPSHVHALTEPEFDELFTKSGLQGCRRTAYRVDIELDAQLRASFPNPGDESLIREMVTADVGVDHLGINTRWVSADDGGSKIVYTVPIAVYLGVKAEV